MPEEIPPEVTRLKLIARSSTTSSRSASSDDQWDRGDTSTHWTVDGVELSDAGDLLADFPVVAGDEVYVIYAIYSTGDSFGQDHRARMEVFSVHKNEETAAHNCGVLRADRSNDDYDASSRAVLVTDSGLRFFAHVPWAGYFESLDSLHMEVFTVGADSETAEEKRERREMEEHYATLRQRAQEKRAKEAAKEAAKSKGKTSKRASA